MKSLVVISVVGVLFLIAFAIWYPATHESKGERISRLEQQVADLQNRVETLEQR